MALYDANGNRTHISMDEFRGIIGTYVEFTFSKDAFEKYGKDYVPNILSAIEAVRKIPEEFRRAFISPISGQRDWNDKNLNALEKKAREQLGKKKTN